LGEVPFSGLRKVAFFEASCGVEDGGLLGLAHLDAAQRYLQDTVDGRYLVYDRCVYIYILYIHMTNDILDIYIYILYIYNIIYI
jgi:hypothetical protein